MRPWNLDEQARSKERCVPQLVFRQSELNPRGTAVAACNESITYAELEERANQTAAALRSLGVARNDLVAICLPRSVAQVVSALGVLKTGAAYIPVDPAYPPERISWMLNDAKPKVMLTRKRISEQFPAGSWHTLNVDTDWKQITSNSSHFAHNTAGPDDLAYVIYTSGSTGRPKGVEITHGNLLNLVLWHQQAFEVEAADRATLLASPAFDAAVWELWPYLTAGASVYLPADNIRNDPESIRDFLVAQGITISFVATPLAESMIELPWPMETRLRVLLTGADMLHRHPPPGLPFQLVNNYGPTECTVVTTSGVVRPGGSQDGCPSIGRPISNVQVYLLDEQREEVSIGTPGEIYIGGAGVARGYLNAPELTAANFVTHPAASETGGRLYRTGDLARYLPDGEIAFLGRIDEQIKIRGFRIEPNEIIAALAENPHIHASYVMAREDGDHEKHLTAYVVAKPGACLTDKELREQLASRLPRHMIPEVFVGIDSLPLNASGKIDRSALPVPDDSNSLHLDNYVAPRTPFEERIATILAPLLGLGRVSVEENFFLLGGHSLLGTQLIARMRQTFGVDLSLRTLFDCPTVAALSNEIERLVYARLEAMSEEEADQFLQELNEQPPESV